MFDPLSLALTPQIGPKRLQKVLHTDGGVETIAEILSPEIALAYNKVLREEKAQQEREKADKLGVRIIGLWEEAYPPALRQLDSPPSVLWLKGELPPDTAQVGIVGTRKASPWATLWTRKVAQELARAGLGVISGLARGIDTEAHQGALEGSGYTLGVLGSAIDKLYPAENRALAAAMNILSEFPLGTPPQAELFPRRNRIIAAFANAVLVVEAGEKSGALITSKFALELGRDVLAVPGRPGDLQSVGCNKLIQDGAGLVLAAEDVLDALGMKARKRDKPVLEGPEAKVYRALLELSEALPDDLAAATELGVSQVLSLLTLLELKGLAQPLPGGRYCAVS